MDVETAIKTLDKYGLNYKLTYVDSDEPEGTVIDQSIAQGEQVKEGTTIELQISNGPQEEKDPDEEEEEENGGNGEDEENWPSLPTSHVVKIPVPEVDTDSVVISYKVDGVLIETLNPLELETVKDGVVPITLSGQGVHQVDIYADGVLYYSMMFDFDTGEVVE